MKFKSGDEVVIRCGLNSGRIIYPDVAGSYLIRGVFVAYAWDGCVINTYDQSMDRFELSGGRFVAPEKFVQLCPKPETHIILSCKVCGKPNEYAVSNQTDGTYICYMHPR